MQTTKSLGALLQGVSQQPQAVRPEGKSTEQINFVSDVVRGLTSRAALTHTAILTAPSGLRFLDVTLGATTYTLGYSTSELFMWGPDGTPYTVAFQDTDAQNYIGTDMRVYVYDDVVYVTNRDTVTAVAASPVASDVWPFSGLAYSLGGKFSRDYTVTLRYASDGAEAVGTYTTPDGTSAGDAEKTNSNYIIGQLRDSLIAHGSFKAGTTTALSAGTMYVNYSAAFSLTADDGEEGETVRTHVDTATDVAQLSEIAPHGTLVRITGADEGLEDDYWLRFNSNTTDTLGAGFGTEGVWEEWYNVAEVSSFDLTTLPHTLTLVDTTFTFARGEWLGRRTGDSETSKFSDFIGYPIRDIGGFQSRLVFAAGPFACMSRTNIPSDFWKKSALAEIATDPISIASTKEGKVTLDWIIPFDRDLVFMSDPGAGQFIIAGSDKITPDNASIAQTTAFEMEGGAKPVQTGRTVVFPYKTGAFSGVNEFFTNDTVATNGASSLTDTLSRYIAGLINHMVCSTNLNTILLKTDNPSFSDTVWVYKYLWSGTDKVQSSWSKWVLPGEVKHFYFDGSEVFVVLWHHSASNYSMNVLDLDMTEDATTGYHVCLDRRQQCVVTGGVVTLPFANASLMQSDGCPSIGSDAAFLEVNEVASSVFEYTMDPDDFPDGVIVTGGVKIARSIQPTMPFHRNNLGAVIPRSNLVITDFLVHFENTGFIETTMTSPYRATSSVSVNWFTFDGDVIDPLGTGLRSGVLEVPWGERADWSTLTIQSDDIRPTTVLEVEYIGEAFKQ